MLVITDDRQSPTWRDLDRLLKASGVSLGVAGVHFDSHTYSGTGNGAALRAEMRKCRPQAVVIGSPVGTAPQVGDLLHLLPKSLGTVWALAPSRSTLDRDRLGSRASALLSSWHRLTIVSPGSVLAGTRGMVADGRLTAGGKEAYAQAIADVLGAGFEEHSISGGAAERADAAGLTAVAAAESRLGDPYVWGGAGPNDFDCSGLVMWAWAHAGVQLPHYSGAQYSTTVPVSMDQLQPGDLLFPSDPGQHVAMYVGGGQIIQAPEPGQDVQVIPLATTGHFFVHARRVVVDGVAGQQSLGSVQAYAYRRLLRTPGWGRSQWPFLVALWDRESGWRVDATNPVSGAYGIPQSLPPTKMAVAGADWRTNPYTQIDWGIAYINGRYGTPQVAWAHESQFGWY